MHVDLFVCTHKVWLYKVHKMQVFPGRTRKEVDGKWDQEREREREDLWMDHAGNRDRRRDDSDADMRRFSSTEEAKRRYNCGSPRHREDRRKILAVLGRYLRYMYLVWKMRTEMPFAESTKRKGFPF